MFGLKKMDLAKLAIPLVYALGFYFFNRYLGEVVFYLAGWYLGIGLLALDKQKLYKFYFKEIHEKNDRFARLITRSFLFILAYLALTIFLLTSSGSGLGVGLVMGIGLSLAFEMWQSRNFTEFFNEYFIQSKKAWTAREINNLVMAFVAFFIVTSLMSIF
jgi:hypothetical protein